MNLQPTGEAKKTLKDYVKSEGAFYHASLAPGVQFNQGVADEVGEAIKRNLDRMSSPPGSEYDIKLSDIF
jgi:hypothetical protein